MTATAEDTQQSRFVAYLFGRDAGDRAELRRCLAAERPIDHLPAYRIVESFASGAKSRWQRECYYLLAGLFAMVERRPPKKRGAEPNDNNAELPGKSLTLARAIKAYEGRSEKGEGNMSSTERRFLALLDSDRDQLPYRLRQMLLMVTRGQNAVSAPLDWAQLLRDLWYWRDDEGDSVRQRWAQQFYEPSKDNDENQPAEEN